MSKDSPLHTEFPIELGGKTYTLSYPLPALWKFEDVSDVDLFLEAEVISEGTPEEIAQESARRFSEKLFGKNRRETMERVVQLLWAGLITFHPEMTMAEVGKFVFVRNLLSLRVKIAEALSASMSQQGEADQEEASAPLAPAVN